MKLGSVVRRAQDGPKNTHGVVVGFPGAVGPLDMVSVRIESQVQVHEHTFTWELSVLQRCGIRAVGEITEASVELASAGESSVYVDGAIPNEVFPKDLP